MDAACSLEMFANQYVKHIIESSATKLKKEWAIEREDIGDTMFSAMKSLCGRITPTDLDMSETTNEGLKTSNEFERNFEAGDSFSGHDISKVKGQDNEVLFQLKFDEDLEVSVGCFVQTVIDTAKEQVKLEMAEKQGTDNPCESGTVPQTSRRNGNEDDTTADEKERIKFFGVFRNNEYANLREAIDRQQTCGNGLTEEDVATFMQVDLKSRSKTPRSKNAKGRKANHQADNDVEKVFSGTDVQYLHRIKTSETEYYHFYKELPNDRVNESYQQEIKENEHQRHTKKHINSRSDKQESLTENRRSKDQKKEVLKENKRTDKQKKEVNENRGSDDQKKDSPYENRRSDNQKKESLFRRIMNTIFGIQKKKEKKDERTKICTGSMADSLDLLSSIGKGDNQTDVTESLSDLQQDMTEDELDFNCDDIEDPPRPTLKPFFTQIQTDVIISQPEPEIEPENERKEKRRFRALTCCFRC